MIDEPLQSLAGLEGLIYLQQKEFAMLVLSRKKNESIIIELDGKIITVTVIDVRGDKIRLGVEAPKEVPVHRSEVYECIKRERDRE